MAIEFVPSVPVAISLAACCALPIVLVVLSHGPLRIAPPLSRFLVAASLSWACWLITLAAVGPGWVDWVTGTLLVATATLAGFTLWTLIAWGFTLSMLLALERATHPLTIEAWTRAYTRGRPLDALARDRLGLLFRLGLAEMRGEKLLVLAQRGRWVARLTFGFRRVFGLSS
jgi:hypothetical protein